MRQAAGRRPAVANHSLVVAAWPAVPAPEATIAANVLMPQGGGWLAGCRGSPKDHHCPASPQHPPTPSFLGQSDGARAGQHSAQDKDKEAGGSRRIAGGTHQPCQSTSSPPTRHPPLGMPCTWCTHGDCPSLGRGGCGEGERHSKPTTGYLRGTRCAKAFPPSGRSSQSSRTPLHTTVIGYCWAGSLWHPRATPRSAIQPQCTH